MQPGLAAIGARPFRLRPDQPHAGAAGIVVHIPGRGEEGRDIRFGEEIRRAMRAVKHAQFPIMRQRRQDVGGQGDGRCVRCGETSTHWRRSGL